MYIKRHLEEIILKNKEFYPVILICGARQTGKSTLLYHLKEEKRNYLTFDNYATRTLASENPDLFIKNLELPVIIDEFQHVPEILIVIKELVDKMALDNKENKSLFWLTGSQQFLMMKNISESLSGRININNLSSLSKSEIEGRNLGVFNPNFEKLKIREKGMIYKNISEIYQMILKGGMPKYNVTNIERETFFSDYIQTYLERDIQELTQVGNKKTFYNFLEYLAGRTACEVNYQNIAKEIGVSAPTIKQWISILEASGIISLIQPFASNKNKRIIKSPKLYFLDTGLCTYLCGWSNAETLEKGAFSGQILETYVVSEIIKSYYNSGKKIDFYYYRDIDQKEIDLIFIEEDKIYPVEIKKNFNPGHADKNFKVLEKFSLNIMPGVILCFYDNLVQVKSNLIYCPISIL